MTQWIIDKVQWDRFLEYRQRIFKAIKENLEVDGHCKSYEGQFTVSYYLPNYFVDDSEKPYWEISLDCYLIGPKRHYEWGGETFNEALENAVEDIDVWLKEHDEWLEKVRNDPNWIIE